MSHSPPTLVLAHVGRRHQYYVGPPFSYVFATGPYFFESRVSLRGTEEPDLFNFVIAGKNINQAQIANDQNLLREVIVKNTTRKDLKLGECPWISYYTFVFAPLLSFEDLHRFAGPTSEW